MNKKKTIIISIIGILVAIILILLILLVTNRNRDNNKSNVPDSPSNKVENKENISSKIEGDFWINSATIPSESKELPVKILDDIAGVPIDLKKLENSDYTFNFYTVDGDTLAPGDYSVKTLAEIQGVNFYAESKEITVKNANDEALFVIKLSNKPSESSKPTYQESIENSWWSIYLNEEKMFGKEFESLSKYHNEDRIQEMLTTLGKPTHIYVDKDTSFAIPDGKTVGTLAYDIVYEYDGFTLVNLVNETYNKPGDYRMINSYGLTYYPKEMYEYTYNDSYLQDKVDVVDQLI